MIAGEGTALVHCPAKAAYEFVLDLERYRLANVTIGAVHSVTWQGNGLFTFAEIGDGVTRVFHREEMVFRRPLAWVVEPLLRGWLEATPQEVRRMKELLEGRGRTPR